MSQMSKVSCKHGAPMGRGSSGDAPKGKVRLFEVRLDRGGYDDGGAYWGTGARLYCAIGDSVDGEGYQRFARAEDRAQAAAKLGLLDSQLCRPVTHKELWAEILLGMVKGPWALWWADRQEEKGRSFSGLDIYDEAPKPPKAARDWAKDLAAKIEALNGRSLETLYQVALDEGYTRKRESFGCDLALQSCGHGISWEDRVSRPWDGPRFKIKLSHAEFYL